MGKLVVAPIFRLPAIQVVTLKKLVPRPADQPLVQTKSNNSCNSQISNILVYVHEVRTPKASTLSRLSEYGTKKNVPGTQSIKPGPFGKVPSSHFHVQDMIC